jgi:hypothetical protein
LIFPTLDKPVNSEVMKRCASLTAAERSLPGARIPALHSGACGDKYIGTLLTLSIFAGYATWNYLLTPFLFLRDGFTFECLASLPGMPLSWAGLRATFPNDMPTHSVKQDFYFDEDRYLRRLDYTAEVVGAWAHAAHLCRNYRDFNGLKISTSRRVRPLFLGSNPLPAPSLVALEIHDIQLINV